MDFSVVGSCIVGHNERWKEREEKSRGEEGECKRETTFFCRKENV